MSMIASASSELKFHQWSNGQILQTYVPSKQKNGSIRSISWSKDGAWVVLIPHDGLPEIVSIKDNVKRLQTIDKVCHPTCAVFQNSTKKNIAISTESGHVLLYDVKSRSIKKKFPAAHSRINHLESNYKDTHLAAACLSGDIIIYNIMTTNASSSFRIPKSENVTALKFHHTRRNLLGAGSDEGIVVSRDINMNTGMLEIQAHCAPTTALMYSPIRSDMLVTAGLDRRFIFHDILTKKKILEVEVTSCITALDFSHCGTYLGLGSLTGGIVLYDTRNLNKPLSTFTAHDKKIYHLLFQKVLSSSREQDSSSINMTSEEISSHLQSVPLQQTNANQSNDLLPIADCGDSVHATVDVELREKSCQESVDSFLAALSLANSSQVDSKVEQNGTNTYVTEEPKKPVDISGRAFAWQGGSHNSPAELKNILQTSNNCFQQMSSTPKLPIVQDLPTTTVSPITSDLPQKSVSADKNLKKEMQMDSHTQPTIQASVSLEEFKNAMREIVKEELQTHMENCKKNIKLEFAEEFRYMRSYLHDFQLFIIKEFMRIEGLMNSVSMNQFVCDEFLLNENHKLLNELNRLKEQLTNTDQLQR